MKNVIKNLRAPAPQDPVEQRAAADEAFAYLAALDLLDQAIASALSQIERSYYAELTRSKTAAEASIKLGVQNRVLRDNVATHAARIDELEGLLDIFVTRSSRTF